MKLPQLPADKANHLVYGFGIYCTAVISIFVIALFVTVNDFLIVYTPLMVTIAFGLYKELKDEKKYKGFDAN
jgi:hypothetical protein